MTPPVPAPGGAGSPQPPGPDAVRPAAFARTAIVAGGLFTLAVVCGLLWVPLSPVMRVTVLPDAMIALSEAEMNKLFGGIGVFALLMFAYGIVCALVSWWGLRRDRGPAGLGFALLSAIGGGAIALSVGNWFAVRIRPQVSASPGDYQVLPDLWLTNAQLGGVPAPWILLICAPLTTALAYLIALLAARSPDLGVGDLSAGDLGNGDPGVGDSGAGELRGGDLRGGDLGAGDSGAGDLGSGSVGAGDPGNRDPWSRDAGNRDLGNRDLGNRDLGNRDLGISDLPQQPGR